jgi:hypothetical protein
MAETHAGIGNLGLEVELNPFVRLNLNHETIGVHGQRVLGPSANSRCAAALETG